MSSHSVEVKVEEDEEDNTSPKFARLHFFSLEITSIQEFRAVRLKQGNAFRAHEFFLTTSLRLFIMNFFVSEVNYASSKHT